MSDQLAALTTIFTEFYFFLTVVLMFFIHVGFCIYEVGAARTKNVQHTLLKNTMAIPLVGLCFFLFGMWIYIAFQGWPVNGLSLSFSTGFEPWSQKIAPNLSDRLSGVFWAAFALFGMTAASIVSGSLIERTKTSAFFIIAIYVGQSRGWFQLRGAGPETAGCRSISASTTSIAQPSFTQSPASRRSAC